jgi:hypothetical protein
MEIPLTNLGNSSTEMTLIFPKGKFSKQMKTKLSYRIIRIKHVFSGVY